MRIEIEYIDGVIRVLLTKTGVQSKFQAKASPNKAMVIFAAIMKNAAELFKTVAD